MLPTEGKEKKESARGEDTTPPRKNRDWLFSNRRGLDLGSLRNRAAENVRPLKFARPRAG